MTSTRYATDPPPTDEVLTTQRAVAFSEYGDPSVLQLMDFPEPHAGAGQVRVRMRAAGVQPFDCAFRRGDLHGFMHATFPQVLGNDFAGVVDEIGEEVGNVRVGDEVLGYCTLAAHAELIVVNADAVVPRPPTLPWEVAGGLSASGQTALNALRDLGVSAGETLLVHAAAGGVGTVAVQLAREWGATVIGTASPGNHSWLESLGITPVTYGPGLVDRVRALAPQGVDVALDCIGGEAVPVSLELVSDRNRIGTIADYSAVEKYGVRRPGGDRSAENLTELVELHTAGRLQLPIHLAVPLDDASSAHAEVETGHVRGKVVLTAS